MFQRTRDYAKDYEKIGKKVTYKGIYYHFTIEQPRLIRTKIVYLLSLIAALALYVAIGFSGSVALGGGGTQTALYVILPYVGLLLPLGLATARALLLVLKSTALEFAEYDKYLVQQKGMILIALILGGCVFVALVIFLLLSGTDTSGQIAAIVESLFCTGCIFLAFRQYHALLGCVTIDETNSVRYDI